MPTDALKEFADYERALATAEAREAKVRTKFDLYDADLSGDGGINIGAARNQRAAEGRAAREAEEARYTQSAADLSRMKKEAVGRDDKGRW